jgi:hypothetical protein
VRLISFTGSVLVGQMYAKDEAWEDTEAYMAKASKLLSEHEATHQIYLKSKFYPPGEMLESGT